MTRGKSLQQLCGAVGDTVVTGLAVDSRRVTPGDLFLARAGSLHDAHVALRRVEDHHRGRR